MTDDVNVLALTLCSAIWSIQMDLSFYFVAKMAEIGHGEQVG